MRKRLIQQYLDALKVGEEINVLALYGYLNEEIGTSYRWVLRQLGKHDDVKFVKR